jgi:drug/metabolite transporter superfamily protein YnfA
MTAKPPEPLNFKLAKITPRWAFPQRARRALVLSLVPALALTVVPATLTQSAPWSLATTVLGLLWIVLSLIWLMGATHSRADSPDVYLDEREITLRNEVYLNTFRWIGALVALLYLTLTLLPDTNLSARDLLAVLFPTVLFAPTLTMAWMAPDPLKEG